MIEIKSSTPARSHYCCSRSGHTDGIALAAFNSASPIQAVPLDASEEKLVPSEPVKQVDIVHSLYLDLPMLLSFLATLEGGVAYTSEISNTVQRTRSSGSEIGGEGKMPDAASLLGLTLGLSGKLHRATESGETIESKLVRQHTAASLFNSLRNRLYAATSVYKIRNAADLQRVAPGSIVELSGSISESPLQRLVDFTKKVYPFIEVLTQQQIAQIPSVKRNRREQLNPVDRIALEAAEASAAAAKEMLEANKKTLELMKLVEDDLDASPIVDFVLQGDGVAGFLAANREYLTDDLIAGLLGGTFKALGKVTAINSAHDARAPVVRRGAMGGLPEEQVDNLLKSMKESTSNGSLRLTLPEGQLRGPHVQMIPLAIFV